MKMKVQREKRKGKIKVHRKWEIKVQPEKGNKSPKKN